VKISAAADPGALLGTDMVPLARAGQATAYRATMTEVATFASASAAAGLNNVGRNLLHNSAFAIAQRGNGPFTANGSYTADRWQLIYQLDTVSVQLPALTDANRAQIGDESAVQCLINTFTGNAGAAAFSSVVQKIESARRLSGKTVTVSFWATAGSGTPKLGVSLDQNMGTGGSPSAAVFGNGQSVTTSITATRYSLTFALASLSGKTLGTNGDDNTQLNFWYSSGTTQAARAGSIGVQSGAIWIWGVQLEIGSVATQLEKPEIRYDVANCQRFYQIGVILGEGYGVAGTPVVVGVTSQCALRSASPTLVVTNNANANLSGSALSGTVGLFYASGTVAATGNWTVNLQFNASADL